VTTSLAPSDLTRIEQSIQRNQAEIKADLQRADRQSAQTLTELQKSVAQLGARLDDLGRDAAQIQDASTIADA
jgi:hypothetical protein